MRKQVNRILLSLATGAIVTAVTVIVEAAFARFALAPTATILDDTLIGIAAALCSYAWVSLLAEREARQTAKIQQETAIREYTRIACEIHDVLAQSFVAMILNVEAAHKLLGDLPAGQKFCERALKTAREGLAESRRLVRALRSPVPSAENLRAALSELVQLLTEGTTIRATCDIDGDSAFVPPEVEGQLLRIVREAVTNVVKHAKASELNVDLRANAHSAELTIQDNGCGFAPGFSQNDDSFGLTSMRERAADLGGTLEIDSQPNRGTRIVLSVPVSNRIANHAANGKLSKAASA
jgi:signal transduction histidine kinase